MTTHSEIHDLLFDLKENLNCKILLGNLVTDITSTVFYLIIANLITAIDNILFVKLWSHNFLSQVSYKLSLQSLLPVLHSI
jgi:hypothetical protein